MGSKLVVFYLLLGTLSVFAFDSSLELKLEDGLVSGNVVLFDFPEIELDQAVRDGFRSELSIILRLVRRNRDRFPWIDQIVEERRIVVTIWHDKHLGYYFVQPEKGQVLALRSITNLINFLSQHQVRFARYIPSKYREYYVFYRAELRPIRLTEPFQLFLFYPFFSTFVTPWKAVEVESASQ